ncbi:MAG: type 4a pilus biogenesis protein PilO [Cephaloticoccus sp.]|nr:type 4a pilus biogenesis protein PilO [Cephaloticoccus sp.]MCF7760064.1 type 4a pilus biogenesis protein PilO [Cephaloticoccus sp.]
MKLLNATFLRQNLFATICAGIILLLAGTGFWLWTNIGSIKADLNEVSQLGENELGTIANSPRLRQALEETHTAVERIEANLAVESKLADNLAYFYSIEERTDAHIRGLNQLNVIESGPVTVAGQAPLRAIPYTLEVSGSYVKVMDFLHNLEAGPRLVKIRSFNIRPTVPGSTEVVLQLDLVMLGISGNSGAPGTS